MINDDAAKRILSANLSRLLDERGMSQQQLADATGENKMTISRIVRGIHVPGLGLASRIAEALGIHIDDLLRNRRAAV